MTFPAHDADEAQSSLVGDCARQRYDWCTGQHVGAMHADINLDDHAQCSARAMHGGSEFGNVRGMVHRDNRIGDRRQLSETLRLGWTDDLVGNQNFADTGCRQHLSLTKLGACDTDGAGREFLLNNLGRLLTIGMRPPTNPDRERLWGLVTLKAPIDGVIIERNITEKEIIVDNTINVFQIANVSDIEVLANAPEDQLPRLKELHEKGLTWNVRTAGAPPTGIVGVVNEIGYIIDPNMHTAILKGFIKNERGTMRAGQYVTATSVIAGVASPAPQQISVVVMSMRGDLLFDSGSTALRPAATTQLTEIAHLLSNTDKTHRKVQLAGDGNGDAALGGAVELGQHDAGDTGELRELARLLQAILARGRVHHQQNFVRSARHKLRCGAAHFVRALARDA